MVGGGEVGRQGNGDLVWWRDGEKEEEEDESSQYTLAIAHKQRVREGAYITVKQAHCTPTCATPSNPAKHSNPLTSVQQAMSARLAGSARMFAKAQVPEVVPRSTNQGEIPAEERRDIMR